MSQINLLLIVEDERIIAKGIEKRLKAMGYAIAGLASSGAEAVEKAVALRPDLILMDIRLGDGMDGIEAAGLIRSQLNVPVVYLTAHSDDATLERAKVTEPFGYVLKPFEDRDLHIAIEVALYKHQMEHRLRENEEWLGATLTSIGDGVIATDKEGRVRFLNSLAEQLTGWTQANSFGREIGEVFQIVHEKTRQPVRNPAIEALATGRNATLAKNTILIDKGGTERPIDDSAAPIRDLKSQVSGAVMVFRDITERCRLEEHLRQAQKMEAIGRLAGGIAHDFNNIMTVITGYSELMLDNPQTAEVSQEFLRQINIAGRRAATLTQQILAFSRKQMLVPCFLSLNTIVRDMGGMIRRLIGEQIEFVTDTAPNLGSVKADPSQLGQVILNLAVNARDAMPNGGKLVISTANAEFDERSAQSHPDLKPGRYAVLAVRDTGCGMSQDVLAHLYEPFFTTKEVGKGTGLGLASVYGIVTQSGGNIEVSSQVGVGTTFQVYLPVAEEPKPEATAPDKRRLYKGDETILLVEDEESVRHMTKMVLQQCGYKVLEAVNGQDAVTVSDSYDGPIHLLITDLVMPQLSGRIVSERLALTRPTMKVLFMSGYTEDTMVHQGVDSATADFLQKPFSLDALASKVREVLDRR